VRVVRASDGQTLATANVSANPPSVSNVALQSAPNPVSGTVTLGWNASDVDGDPLTFDIFYSRDSGVTLQPLKLNVHGNTAQLDTTRLGGGTAIFHVIASDGVNTAYADSTPFTMASKLPQPHILTPNNGLHIHAGQLVNLSGEAEDFQDGSVSGAKLVWSNQQGLLGTGSQLSVSNLPVGVNTITLMATNGVAQSASTSITIVVDDDLSLPGPTLIVGPTQIAWEFPADASQSRAATLNIGNAGSGTLNWTASTNMAGLGLSVNSGTAPAGLTLTMNPTGIPNGTTRSGQVTITNSNQPAQVMTVPVNIAVGTSFTDPSGYRPQHLYLPIMIR